MEKMLLTAKDGKFYLNDQPFFLCSGDIHYFRIHPTQWAERLRLMKDFGLTAVQLYCPWNLHEPKRGEYHFDGILDLGRFIDLAAEAGLKVLLRPSPYMCSEWDLGGMPSWLLKDRSVVLRSCHPSYIVPAEEYLAKICKIAVPRLSTNGGPIIAVALENEFGSYSLDPDYMAKNMEIMRENGIDVPLYVTDGDMDIMLVAGKAPDILFHGVNFRAKPGFPANAKEKHQHNYPGQTMMIGEFWTGRSMHWEEPFHYRNPEEASESFRESLEMGAFVNFYMFSGGSNFGPMSGGNFGFSYEASRENPPKYIPHTTSYDEDSLISEYGVPTKKYFLCRDVLDEFLGKPKRAWETYGHRAQRILNIPLTESAYLMENLAALTEIEEDHVGVRCMEDIGQDYGFLLYSTQIPKLNVREDVPLIIKGIHDRATVYMDGQYIATRTRDRDEGPIITNSLKNGVKLDILVENMARINFGHEMQHEYKGITDIVRLKHLRLNNWKHRAITLEDISGLKYRAVSKIEENQPVFLKGIFDAEEGTDTFVSFAGFTRGYIWVNDFCLGRYSGAGPQMTLYCPGALLKEKGNVIQILDINPTDIPTGIDLLDHHRLEMD